MNSDAKRVLSHYDAYDRPDIYQAYYSTHAFWDRLTNPANIVPVVLLVLTILYQAVAQRGRIPPLSSFLWNCLVSLIPAVFLYTADRWLNPPLFPTLMRPPQPHTHAAKSETLRRILGLDKPGGLIQSVSQAGRRGLTGFSSAALGLKLMVDEPPGLGNYDNSCYQNSILQSLASLKPLPKYLSAVPAPDDGRPVVGTADALQTLITDLNNPSNSGKTLWTPGVLKNMSTWQQQDAQEYYSKLLDEIDKEIARAAMRLQKPPGLETEPPHDDTSASQHSDDSGYQSLSSSPKTLQESRSSRNPLEGLVAQRVACVACGYCEGLSMIPFNCLTLNLGINHAEHDLYERLDNFAKVEPIQGVHCAKCSLIKVQTLVKQILSNHPDGYPELHSRLVAIEEALEEDAFDDETLKEKCKITPQKMVTSIKTKQTAIARPPQSLAIHMNRSVFDENTGRLFKNLAAVRFPKLLDLGPWCLGSADRYTGAADTAAEGSIEHEGVAPSSLDEEEWLLDPLSSMVAGDLRPSKVTGPIYELRAVVTHYGQHENGHYVCYRRHTAPGRPPQQKGTKPPKLAAESLDDEVASLDGTESVHKIEVVATEAEDKTETEEAEGTELGSKTELKEVEGPTSDALTQWWRLSDHDVYKVDEETVLAQGGVFMLFYDCVDPNSVLVSDVHTPSHTKNGSSASETRSITPDETDISGCESSSGEEKASLRKRASVRAGLEGETGVVEAQDDVLLRAVTTPLPE